MTINQRISRLRLAMQNHQIDAYIIPSNDPHQSEYVADHWQCRAWISGFNGSAGTVIVTKDHAGLWTDSRYFIQAETELADSSVILHKLKVPHTAEHLDWLLSNAKAGALIGTDGSLFSAKQIRSLKKKLGDAGMSLNTEHDLFKDIWENRPGLPQTQTMVLDTKYAGQSAQDKLALLREKMSAKDCDHLICTTLDDIAWTLNIRGRDVAHSPVNICYLVVSKTSAQLYIDSAKLDKTATDHLKALSVSIAAYKDIQSNLAKLPASDCCWVDASKLSQPLYAALAGDTYEAELPSTILKACKNETEVSGIRSAMRYDGVALTRLFMWLEKTIQERSVPETEVAKKLANFRSQQPGYFEESFPAIVGYKGNGAIVHYHAEEDSCAAIQAEGILLLDSGGQYQEGTTDITRTVALGTPSKEQRQNFTRVLQGHIALDSLVFPEGTKGGQMDILARQPLWQAGLNYGHGTGHGVGHFLNVHEGPQAIGSGVTGKGAQPFLKGMFTSNEPGFYKKGEYGIRIENLVLCVDGPASDFGKFLQFENLTLFPIDQSLIDFPMLRRAEVQWLNDYHTKVYDLVQPLLEPAEQAWLKEKCKPLGD